MTISTTMAPAKLITGPHRFPVSYGLLSAVMPVSPEDDHWQLGVEWESQACGDLGVIGEPGCEGSGPDSTGGGTPGLPKDLDGGVPGLDSASPFTIYAPYRCSPMGRDLGQAQELATTRLIAQEQRAVERAFWTGARGNHPNLTDDVELTETVMSPQAGLAWLEYEFSGSDQSTGSQGMIHMSRWAAAILYRQGRLERSSSRLVTGLGTPVVAGSGYGSDAALVDGVVSDRMVITPQPFLYRSGIFTSSNREGDLLDRGVNDLYAIAERTYVLGFDSCPSAWSVRVEFPAESVELAG